MLKRACATTLFSNHQPGHQGVHQDQTAKSTVGKCQPQNDNLAMPPSKSPAILEGWLGKPNQRKAVLVTATFLDGLQLLLHCRFEIFQLTVSEPTSLAGRRRKSLLLSLGEIAENRHGISPNV